MTMMPDMRGCATTRSHPNSTLHPIHSRRFRRRSATYPSADNPASRLSLPHILQSCIKYNNSRVIHVPYTLCTVAPASLFKVRSRIAILIGHYPSSSYLTIYHSMKTLRVDLFNRVRYGYNLKALKMTPRFQRKRDRFTEHAPRNER